MNKALLDGVFENVLVFAPHSDDDILGCGGTMSRIVKAGGNVHVVVVTVGDVLFYHSNQKVMAQTREQEFHEALASIGVSDGRIMYHDHEQRLDMVPTVELVTQMDDIIREVLASLPGYLVPKLVREIAGEKNKTPLFGVQTF